MTVVDLVGRGRGDVAGLAALASRLRRAAMLLEDTGAVTAEAIRRAALMLDTAAERLRDLPAGTTALEVEADLARDLSSLLGSERTL